MAHASKFIPEPEKERTQAQKILDIQLQRFSSVEEQATGTDISRFPRDILRAQLSQRTAPRQQRDISKPTPFDLIRQQRSLF